MAYAILVQRSVFRHSGRHRNGWISAFGYTISENLESARRFTEKIIGVGIEGRLSAKRR
jgi:hypothetical protein